MPSNDAAPANGRHVRTRTGCWTCRFRKKKCDENRPSCNQCTNLRLTCDGYDEQPVWMRDEEMAQVKKKEIKEQMVRRSRRKRKSQLQQKPAATDDKPDSKKDEESKTPTTTTASKPKSKASVIKKEKSSTPKKEKPGIVVSTQEISYITKEVSGIAVRSREEAEIKFENGNHDTAASRPDLSLRTTSLSPADSYDNDTVMSDTSPIQSTCSTTNPYSGLLSAVDDLMTIDNSRGRIFSIDESIEDDDDDSQTTSKATKGPLAVLPSLEDNFFATNMPVSGKLDVNLVKLYVGNIFHVTYRALSESQLFKYNSALILPMFYTNPSFFHGCLSSSALHLTATNTSAEATKQLKTQVYKHRSMSLRALKKELDTTKNYRHVIATICALISFEVYSRTTKWQVHVKAATECVRLLNWTLDPPTDPAEWFMFSRVLWLDIIGSITRGEPSYFHETFRQMLFLPPHLRSRYRIGELIGCDDAIMFILSEVVCLEAWKLQVAKAEGTLSEELVLEVQRRGEILDQQLRREDPLLSVNMDLNGDKATLQHHSDSENDYPSPPISDTESVRDEELDSEVPEVVQEIEDFNIPDPGQQLNFEEVLRDRTGTIEELEDHQIFANAVTNSFRTATRIYIAVIMYGYQPQHPRLEFLLEELMLIIQLIPSGTAGYDRSIVTPLLIGGSIAVDEEDRNFFLSRCRKVPRLAKYGNLGSVDKILRELWTRADAGELDGCWQVPWREIMDQKGWQYLMV